MVLTLFIETLHSDFNEFVLQPDNTNHIVKSVFLWVFVLSGACGDMGTVGEIKSPEGTPATPVTVEMEKEGNSSDHSYKRKKLGLYFMESDDRRTALGGGYTGGTTPVNLHGKPIVDLSKTGGWIAAFFIFGKCLNKSSTFKTFVNFH